MSYVRSPERDRESRRRLFSCSRLSHDVSRIGRDSSSTKLSRVSCRERFGVRMYIITFDRVGLLASEFFLCFFSTEMSNVLLRFTSSSVFARRSSFVLHHYFLFLFIKFRLSPASCLEGRVTRVRVRLPRFREQVTTLDAEYRDLVRQLVQFSGQRSEVRMPQCRLGTYPLIRIELKQRRSHAVALGDVVEPRKR